VDDAARESSQSQQKDFPVMDGNAIAGLLLHRDLVRALAQGGGNRQVGEFVRRDCLMIDVDEPLERVLDKMNACGCSTLLVQQKDQLVGILSEEHLGQWLMLHSSVRQRASERPSRAA
jgi:predicted transcriptional regulator